MSKTAGQRKDDFQKALNSLLLVHGAELEMVDVGPVCDGWHHAQAVQVTMERNSENEWCEFQLAI